MEILHLREPVNFFLLICQTPFRSLNFLVARGRASLKLGGVDGSRIYDFLQGVFIWFSPGFRYFSVISNANPSREKKTCFSIVWQEKAYMEGNQSELLQIKPNGATSMLGVLPPGAPERKTAFHTSASARMAVV